jgi:hypothetical protein
MAVQRALMFTAGSVGPTCAAMEVAIERGTDGREGTIRGIGECDKPTAVLVIATGTGVKTGFCADCGDAIAHSSDVGVVVSRIPKG